MNMINEHVLDSMFNEEFRLYHRAPPSPPDLTQDHQKIGAQYISS